MTLQKAHEIIARAEPDARLHLDHICPDPSVHDIDHCPIPQHQVYTDADATTDTELRLRARCGLAHIDYVALDLDDGRREIARAPSRKEAILAVLRLTGDEVDNDELATLDVAETLGVTIVEEERLNPPPAQR